MPIKKIKKKNQTISEKINFFYVLWIKIYTFLIQYYGPIKISVKLQVQNIQYKL